MRFFATCKGKLEFFVWYQVCSFQTKSHQENLKMRKSSKWQFRQTERNILDSPKVNVWCCLIRDRVIGPYFLKRKLSTSKTIWTCWNHFVFPNWTEIQILKCFSNKTVPRRIGPCRWDSFLDQHFPNRWIGRDGPHAGPPRSTDLTPLDFFLWGYVKDRVNATPVRDIDHLKGGYEQRWDLSPSWCLLKVGRNWGNDWPWSLR